MIEQQRAVRFRCGPCWLVGVLHLPAQPRPRGLLIVTGGPQYRAGSHRQFVLLARHLSDAGIPVLRFDYRGMGDSEGEPRHFEQIEADLHAAVRHFFSELPAMRELVLWGLCDAATAAAFHALREPRVRGLILLNPWVRTAQGNARATLRHYYLNRLRDPAFWRKLFGGDVALRRVLLSLRHLARAASIDAPPAALPERLYQALSRFDGRMLFILSGADLTAREFRDLQTDHAHWRELMAAPRVVQAALPTANHTFSRAAWRDEVARLSAEWIASW